MHLFYNSSHWPCIIIILDLMVRLDCRLSRHEVTSYWDIFRTCLSKSDSRKYLKTSLVILLWCRTIVHDEIHQRRGRDKKGRLNWLFMLILQLKFIKFRFSGFVKIDPGKYNNSLMNEEMLHRKNNHLRCWQIWTFPLKWSHKWNGCDNNSDGGVRKETASSYSSFKDLL